MWISAWIHAWIHTWIHIWIHHIWIHLWICVWIHTLIHMWICIWSHIWSHHPCLALLACLQALREGVRSREPAALLPLLPPWVYMYRKLIMDTNRTVRAEAAGGWAAAP